VGDSITAGFAPTEGTTVRDRNSWIPFADQDERLTFAGGYAVPGATTTVMRDGITPVDADVLVVMGGTNDLGAGTPWETVRSNLLQIVATAGVPVVTLSAIPPRDDVAAGVLEFNAQLERLATEQGWHFVDPWSGMSDDGAWVAGTSDDGIHPVEQVVSLVGQRLAAAVVAAG
jgi:lysophospholipase L1-like esterase